MALGAPVDVVGDAVAGVADADVAWEDRRRQSHWHEGEEGGTLREDDAHVADPVPNSA